MASKATMNLFNVNIVGLCSRKNDLLQHLNALHKALRVLTQEDSVSLHKVLKSTTAPQLISPKLLSHNDKEVKLLCACCIVDTFRLLAPDNPYNNEDTIAAFNLVVNQLRGLATFAPVTEILASHVYYILNNIATVQSCVVPVLLAMDGVFGADEVAVSMFSAILSSLRVDHPTQVLAHAAEILQLCIIESEGKNEEILEQLLLPLLPQNKTDNPAAYQVAATVIRHAASVLQGPVSEMVNHILIGSSRESIGSSSEIADQVYSLIHELHRISPALLNAILPSVCLQLQVEDEEVRCRAATLLGLLFASPQAEYGTEFARNFKEYLGRSGDVAVAIRLEVVGACGGIAQAKPALRKQLEAPLVARLRDPDERLRHTALTRLIDLAFLDPAALQAETYTEMAERVKDKKPDIRRLGMVGLSRIYNRHVATQLPGLSTVRTDGHASLRDSLDPDVLEKLQFIPGLVLNCWGFPEMSTKHLVVHLLQEVLLPKPVVESNEDATTTSSSPSASGTVEEPSRNKKITAEASNEANDRRASALLLLFETLSSADRNALAAVLGFKAKVRSELMAFLKIRAVPVKTGRNSDAASRSSHSSAGDSSSGRSEMSADEHMRALRKCILKLMLTVPAADKKVSHFETIYAKKDRTVFRLLESCVSPADSVAQSVQRREDLKQRLVSKSPLGEYIGTVFDLASFMAANAGVVQSLLVHMEGLSVSADATSSSELLSMLAKYAPQAFQGSSDEVSAWLRTCVEFDAGRTKRDLKAQLLGQCLSMVSSTCAALEGEASQHSLCTELVEHIKHAADADVCERLAELAGQIAYHSPYSPAASGDSSDAVRAVRTLIQGLSGSKALTLRNKRLDCDLAALGALVMIPKAAYVAMNFSKPSFLAVTEMVTTRAAAMSGFVRDTLLAQQTTSSGEVTARTVALGLKVLTNVIFVQAELAQIRQKAASAGGNASTASDPSAAEKTAVKQTMKELKELTILLFDCIKTSGGQLGEFTTEDEVDKEVLFEASASCALSLMKLHAFATAISVDQWHTLGWTLLCPVAAIRQRLFGILSLAIQMHPLHAKFLAYPCLFATDDSLYARAEQALGFAVQRRRRTHEELCAQAIGSQTNQPQLQKLTESLMPESILPYLLHLLSYHPEFPASTAIETETDKRRMKNLVRSVSMLLQVLQNSLINESCNMSYLLKLLNTANRFYIDKHDPDNVGLHFVTRMTVKLLHEQVKTSDNLQIHPGDVSLPAELYQRKVGISQDGGDGSVAVMMLGAGTAEGYDEAESAIDKALQIAGRSNKPQKAGAARARAAVADDGPSHASRKRAHAESPGDDNKRRATEKARSSFGTEDKAAPAVASRLPEEAPTRVVPKRGAREVVSYREPVESEREMLQWEEAAAKAKKPRRSSELSLPRSSYGSTAAEERAASNPRGRTSESSAAAGSMAAWIAGAKSQEKSQATTADPAEAVKGKTGKTRAPSMVSDVADDTFDFMAEDPFAEDEDAPKKSKGKDTAAPARNSSASGKDGKDRKQSKAAERKSGADAHPEHVPTPAPTAAPVVANTSSSSKARALQPKGNAAPVVDATVELAGKSKTGTKARAKATAPKEVAVEEEVAVPPAAGKGAKAQKGKGKQEAVVEEVAPAGPRRSARPMRA